MNMKKSFFYSCWLLALMLLGISSSVFSSNHETKRVLIVVSSHGLNNGQEQPGFEFDELSKAYFEFVNAGIAVDIASPKGGSVEADKYNPEESYNKRFLEDNEAMIKLNNSLPIADITSDEYEGIFIVGGKGAMFDFHNNKALQSSIADIYQSGGVVAAVCHGPAALVNVTLDNGDYLVDGKAVNGFTNTEEKLFGKKWAAQFEFMLENRLQERGGKFESSPMMLSHVAIDGRLITGQNPTSTVDTARAMIKAMGAKPGPLEDYQDDKTLGLVADILKNADSGVKKYRANESEYKTELIGMYGYYNLMVAETDESIQQSLTLMKLAQEKMKHPQLGLAIAQAHQKLNNVEQAKLVLKQMVKLHPDLEEAKAMLESL
ncbi:hypothetical protein GCM10011356_21980 [Kangiella profundi]|nr:hypothetical protein GCM10011356_21980 [Kangiella profundi]